VLGRGAREREQLADQDKQLHFTPPTLPQGRRLLGKVSCRLKIAAAKSPITAMTIRTGSSTAASGNPAMTAPQPARGQRRRGAIAELEYRGADEGAEKCADDAADEATGTPITAPDQPSEQLAPQPDRVDRRSARKAKPEPVVDDLHPRNAIARMIAIMTTLTVRNPVSHP